MAYRTVIDLHLVLIRNHPVLGFRTTSTGHRVSVEGWS